MKTNKIPVWIWALILCITACGRSEEQNAKHDELLKAINRAEMLQSDVPLDQSMLEMHETLASMEIASEAARESARVDTIEKKQKIKQDKESYRKILSDLKKAKANADELGRAELDDFFESDKIFTELCTARKRLSNAIERNDVSAIKDLKLRVSSLNSQLSAKSLERFGRHLKWRRANPKK